MSLSVSDQISQRYSLSLDPHWQRWFDNRETQELLVGPFQHPIDMAEFSAGAPHELWPGFMLPDSLPIISNGYGDWLCVRVGTHNSISEVVYWFHGGGDWIPVGRDVASAALWDVLSGFRSHSIHRRHAAHEYPTRPTHDPLAPNPNGTSFVSWVAADLQIDEARLLEVFTLAQSGSYAAALQRLSDLNLCRSAVLCELSELALQSELEPLASPVIAAQFGMNWIPDFTSWLFDTDRIPHEAKAAIVAENEPVSFHQDWQQAEQVAITAQQEHSDLSWPFIIAGWAAQRRGNLEEAAKQYFQGRKLSAFTDQSVRLRSHWFPERFGKFTVAQLHQLRDYLTPEQVSDPYLQILWTQPLQSQRNAIRQFFMSEGNAALVAGRAAEAYEHYYRAGWDLGAERLSDYKDILEALINSADQAGWHARARVAEAHLAALNERVPR